MNNAFLIEVTKLLAMRLHVEIFAYEFLGGGTVDIVVQVSENQGFPMGKIERYRIRARDINLHGVEACYVNALQCLRFQFEKERNGAE